VCSGRNFTNNTHLIAQTYHDDAIICLSDDLALCSDSAESVYAAIVDSSIMICCCIRAERSVQRPNI
jgi:hypothetical protein